MAVDYIARKTAKKTRKREALAPKRERKKKQARRLCRGPCYQEPKLTAEDLAEGEESAGIEARSTGELAKFANLTFGQPERKTAQAAASSKGAPKQQSGAKRKQAAREEDGEGGKKRKLSTAINLLEAKTAKMEAPRQRQLPPSAVSPELQQLPELVQRFMAGEGFAEPMPIQSRCWPVLLEGRDVQAVAEPGSGKTLAYLLPAAVLLAKQGHGAATKPGGPLALILLPTRELAQQVASTCRDLRKYSGLRTCCITGGVDKEQQVEALSKQPHMMVATPGRLLDLVQDNTLQLGHVRYVVLDEADKMLGLGFAPQIDQLKALLLPQATAGQQEGVKKKKKAALRVQVGLFTATMPDSVAEVAAAWLHSPEHIQVSASAASISRTVTQVVQVCAEHKKPAKLMKHMARIKEASQGMRNPPRVLVFTNRIKTCRFVHKLLSEAGHRATLLHGERSQEERDAAMADFRSGKAQVLVATDVAARGLHVSRLAYLVNYDFPGTIETYVHRVGRTGRLATDGHAFSFFTREMARMAPAVLDLLHQHSQQIDPNLEKLAEAWKIASEKLGLLADATGGEAAVPQKEEVLRELGMKTQQQKKKERRQQQKRQQERSDSDSESEDDGGSGGEDEGGAAAGPGTGASGQRGAQDAREAQVPADEREPPPHFMPGRKFAGARPGYAFKQGPRGLGYYLDPVQQQQQQHPGGKRAKAVSAAKQQQKEEMRQLKQKYTHAPIGGSGADVSKPAASSKLRQEQALKRQQAAQAAKQHLLPGRLKELKRQRQQAAAAGQLAGFSSEDDEDIPTAPPASKRPKALPGRLRKKLAKQRADNA